MALARRLCDRVSVINEGGKIVEGPQLRAGWREATLGGDVHPLL